MSLFCGWVQSYRENFFPYLIVTWGDNVIFFSNLAPKQSVDKSRVDSCGKVKYKDSLGSRCFPFNDSLTGDELSRALSFLPTVCTQLGASTKPASVTFQVRPLCQEFPTQPAEGGRAAACTPVTRFRKGGIRGKKGTLGAMVHDEGFKVAEGNKLWALPENGGPSTCMELKKKSCDGMSGEQQDACVRLW